MKKYWLVMLALFSCFALSGCSGLLDSLREESEEAEREAQREEAYYGGKTRQARRLSANNVSDYAGEVGARARNQFSEFSDRAAAAGENAQRRYSRADFIDNQPNENSLWNAQGQSNYYFAQNNRFDNGDLVIVSVDRGLRREIQYALWKSLPTEQRRIKRKLASEADKLKQGVKSGEKDAEKAAAAVAQAASSAAREADERAAAEEAAKSSMGAEKDGDLIRMEIVENLGNGLVRLQGEKRVIYRGRPKFVEVSALARGSDIDAQSKMNAQSFLDMRTRVLQ